MTLATREVRERHLVRAANGGLEMMDRTRESIRRKPFANCTSINKGTVNSLRRRHQHAMKFDCVRIICCHDFAPLTLSRTAQGQIDNQGMNYFSAGAPTGKSELNISATHF